MRTSTSLPRTAAITIALALGAASTATMANVEPPQAVYSAGSHFTATLHQASGLWQLQPLDGQDLQVTVDGDCAAGATLPEGVWLVLHEADGLVLQAPSTTALPAGHPGRVALADCNVADAGGALRLPAQLIDLLAANTGAVYVAD